MVLGWTAITQCFALFCSAGAQKETRSSTDNMKRPHFLCTSQFSGSKFEKVTISGNQLNTQQVAQGAMAADLRRRRKPVATPAVLRASFKKWSSVLSSREWAKGSILKEKPSLLGTAARRGGWPGRATEPSLLEACG